MRVLFLGTPEFAATILGRLLESRHEVVGVVTQPPRQAGRGLGTSDPPAARLARERGIPVFQPENLYDPEVLAQLSALAPDLGVTAAFGRILKKSLLELPANGIWNVHTSLLPRHRGAAPVPAAILAGDRWTGVTLFQLDRGMDTGALLLQSMTAIGPKETAGALTLRLAALGGDLLVDGIDREAREPLLRRPQPPDGITYAPPLEKEDGRIDWRRPAEQVDRWIRAVMPWPGAFTFFGTARIAILEAEPLHEMPSEAAPGTVVAIRSGLEVACLPGVLRLQTVQQEGRKAQAADVWARGARIAVGSVLSSLAPVPDCLRCSRVGGEVTRSMPPQRRDRRTFAPRNQRERAVDPVRGRALLVLTAFETDPRPIRQPLEEAESHLPDERDRGLLRNLVLEVLRHRSRLDWLVGQYLRKAGPETLAPELRNVLRLGAVQAVVMERIPPHAIVSTTVDLAHAAGHPGAAGLVNAVTRRIVESGRALWDQLDAPQIRGGSGESSLPHTGKHARGRSTARELDVLTDRFALRYSHPPWLVSRWLPRLGADRTERLLAWNNENTGTWLRLAPGTSVPEGARPGWVPDSAWCEPGSRPALEDAFARGEFTIQDASAILVGHLPPRPRGLVLDLCAAPGTKARHLAERAEPNAVILAIDRSWNRVRRLEGDRSRTERTMQSTALRTLVADGRHIPVRSGWDGALIDAPCSNLGVIGRRVDVRWRVTPGDIEELAILQREMLRAAAAGVRPGGWVVFSVCTIEPEETTEQRRWFFSSHAGWNPIEVPDFVPATARREPGEVLLIPGEHGTDGTYAFTARRVK